MPIEPKKVSVLITWDVDPDRWATAEYREKALSMVLDLCEEFGIRSTFYFTANYAHEYPGHIERMLLLGQEVGCHGLMHTDEEDYDRMPADQQRAYLEEATQKLAAVARSPIYSFRSPRVKTSGQTLQMLSNCGYQADSSVCSQRVDFISSNLINFGWVVAPRRSYHPHAQNAYRRGRLPIWEVPVSATILPFISSSFKVLGVRAMKALFWLLYLEARITGKPIVYLAHPIEFVDMPVKARKLTFADFSPTCIRTHGFLVRNYLFRLWGKAFYEATHKLFAYIASLPDISFMTCNEYVRHLNQLSIKNGSDH